MKKYLWIVSLLLILIGTNVWADGMSGGGGTSIGDVTKPASPTDGLPVCWDGTGGTTKNCTAVTDVAIVSMTAANVAALPDGTIASGDTFPGRTAAGTLTEFTWPANLASIAGLTFADASILQLTGAGASAVLTSGGANRLLGSNSDNSALEFKTSISGVTFGGFTAAHIPQIDGSGNLAGAATATWGGIIFGDSTPDAEGEFGYASNQLTVHDGTAARSVLQVASTIITKTEFLPIQWAKDDDSVTAPAATAEIGTTTLEGRSFVEDADNGVVFWWHVPLDYSAGVKYRVYYAIQTDAGADETVAFALSGCSNGNTDAIACSEGTAVNVVDELTTDYDANELIVSDWSTAVTVTDIAAGELAKLLFIRDVSEDDYDDADDNVFVVAIEIKYQAKVNASGDY